MLLTVYPSINKPPENGIIWLWFNVEIFPQAEITLKGFIRHKQAAVAPAPLTTAEEELAELKRTEVNVGVSVDSRHQTLTGVAFPMSKEAEQAITAMAHKTFNYVQLRIGLYP